MLSIHLICDKIFSVQLAPAESHLRLSPSQLLVLLNISEPSAQMDKLVLLLESHLRIYSMNSEMINSSKSTTREFTSFTHGKVAHLQQSNSLQLKMIYLIDFHLIFWTVGLCPSCQRCQGSQTKVNLIEVDHIQNWANLKLDPLSN